MPEPFLSIGFYNLFNLPERGLNYATTIRCKLADLTTPTLASGTWTVLGEGEREREKEELAASKKERGMIDNISEIIRGQL